MIKRFKHIFFITLISAAGLFFLAGQTFDFLVFKFRQNAIRKEIKQQIKQGVDESDLFVFRATEIYSGIAEWIRPGKEFRLNGTMYDIVKTEVVNGKVVFKCINDSQETQLFAELDELVRKRMQNDSDDELKNFMKDFLKVYYHSKTVIWIPLEEIAPSAYTSSFISFSLNNPSPPPRIS